MMEQVDNCIYIDASISQHEIRNLDEKVGGKYRVLIADSPDIALIGLDFRSFNNGITLLVLKPFRHQREMLQAANRVGRGGDRCSRVIRNDI